MYNRILVPTDGSELSDKALEAAADFAKALGSSIVIITVIEPYSYTNLSEYRPESIDQYDSRVKEMAQERLEIARELVEKKDIIAKLWLSNPSLRPKRLSMPPMNTTAI